MPILIVNTCRKTQTNKNDNFGDKPMSIYRIITDRIKLLLTTPHEELGRWQAATRFLIELCVEGVRQLKQDKASQMAAALAFRTIFGLVPVLVIAMVLFRAFGGVTTFQSFVGNLLEKAHLNLVELPSGMSNSQTPSVIQAASDVPDDDSAKEKNTVLQLPGSHYENTDVVINDDKNAEANQLLLQSQDQLEDKLDVDNQSEIAQGESDNSTTSADTDKITIATWLTNLIYDIDDKISFRSIGLVGILLLAWAAIGLLTTIERSFNTICRAPEHRSITRRLPLYWLTITIGPTLLYLSFYIAAQFDKIVRDTHWGNTIITLLGSLSSFGTIWLFLLVLFIFMPNTKVKLGPAALGAFISALLWSVCTNLVGAYIGAAFSDNMKYSILYSSLGLVPIILLWIYFQWLFVLFGLEIASTLQLISGSSYKKTHLNQDKSQSNSMVDPVIAIAIVSYISERFTEGKTSRLEQIAEHINIDLRNAKLLLDILVESDILLIVEAEDTETFTLSRPVEKIDLGNVLRVSQQLLLSHIDKSAPSWKLISKLQELQLDHAHRLNLKYDDGNLYKKT